MPLLPRLAIGAVRPKTDSRTMLAALIESLRRSGVQVQSFLSRACFPTCHDLTSLTGRPPRHLDSWLMSAQSCSEAFIRGSGGADLALVQGRYEGATCSEKAGGRLETLCRWLNLPRLVVFDADRIERQGLPEQPPRIDGILLDRVADRRHFVRLATEMEALWAVPVLGGLESLPRLRARLESLPGGQRPSPCFAEELVDQFTRYWQPDRIGSLAVSREFPRGLYAPSSTAPAAAKLTVAIAYDEAFNRYFQDTLDLLELRGASIVDFSPLRDESLPPDTDLVYLGCGHPERYAAALSENHCMKAALRSHLAAGHRLYAEGGGAAYLCQQMETPKGEWKRMVGIFPAAASLKRAPQRSAPVEVTLNRPNWLGPANARLRGYRNPRWEVRRLGRLTCFASDDPNHCDLMGSFRAIGSLLHLDFAAQPASLERFFYPGDPQPVLGDPWAAVLEAGD